MSWMKIPGPRGAFGDEIVTSHNKLANTKNSFLLKRRDGTRSGDPLYSPFEGFMDLLR